MMMKKLKSLNIPEQVKNTLECLILKFIIQIVSERKSLDIWVILDVFRINY